ncbi:TonB-dependent receptor [Chryseobacterium balustinum]|uniref:Outer membrane cobalamin translocator n=1 Tax=Chryseobacterium balustinum TaxID=246 RepID=A0AAX2IMY4_9FLAO|nr:TonB-dependent receptor plug domain-containing protein [Chryseobacterium balustinum]AZB30130.1 TonB-dependent receptor [Chryseobacterium balustinum]SKB65534.1 Outer membrane receptor proteins, mostly Fe transport [Chryseobacterium balustinum]SQA90752.1 Outer membrane cobalamin translocator [Chryseobacterium balustinum]
MKITKIIVAFLALSFNAKVLAQETEKKLLIKDADDKFPIADVLVQYDHGNSHAHSGEDGTVQFSIKSFPDTLVITHKGYDEVKWAITNDEDKNKVVFLQHKPFHISEVSINHNSFLTAITKVDLNKFPVNSAQDLLRKVPGLFIAQHAGGGKAEQLFLRGFDADHGTDVSVNVDGMPVNVVSHAHGQGYSDLHFVIPETVNNIDFGKGAYYMDRGDFNTAGYVDFKTYDHLQNSMIKLEGGSFNSKRILGMFNILNDTKERKSVYLAAEYNYTDGAFDVKQNFNRINIFGKYNQWITDNDYFNLQFSNFNSSWNASGQIPERAVNNGIIDRWQSIDPTEGGETSRTNVEMNYKHIISPSENIEAMAFYSKYNFNLYSDFTFYLKDKDYGDEIQQTDGRNMYGMEVKHTKNFSFDNSSLNWISGIGFRNDDINTLQLNHVYHRDLLLDRLADVQGTETNLHAFSGLIWKTGKFTINPALRVDHFIFNLHDLLDVEQLPSGQSKEETRLSPKLNFSYAQNDNIMWFLKTGMGFHSNDIRVVVANKNDNTLPYSLGGDFGVRLHPFKSLIITPTLWYMYLQQEFVYVGDEAVVEPSGKSRRFGADLGIRFQPLENFYLNADINYSHARFIEEENGQDYVPLAPVVTSTGSVNWDFMHGFSLGLQYRYLGERPAVEDNSIRTKAYFVNDLMLSYNRQKWGANIQVNNLFNVKWNEAQFATETQLKGESEPITDLTYTPGNPFGVRVGLYYKF